MTLWAGDVFSMVHPADPTVGLPRVETFTCGIRGVCMRESHNTLRELSQLPCALLVSDSLSPALLWHSFLFVLHLSLKGNDTLIQSLFPKDNSQTRCIR